MEGTWNVLLELARFFFMVWILGRGFKVAGVSSLVGEMTAGVLVHQIFLKEFPLADKGWSRWMILAEKTQRKTLIDALQIVGHMGVACVIAESGLHINFKKIKEVGLRGAFVGALGVLVPLLCGWGMMYPILMYGDVPLKRSFACGAALTPTSTVMAIAILTEAGRLNSLTGQTIMTAAAVDDVLAIMTLVITESLSTGTEKASMSPAASIGLSLLYAALILGGGTLLSIYVMGEYFPSLLAKIEPRPETDKQPRDDVHLLCMLLALVACCVISHYTIKEHLLGAFVSGILFCKVPRSMFVWRRQFKRIMSWMIRCFFAATIAFSLPVSALFSARAAGWGLLLGVVAAIGGKLVCGFVVTEHKLVTGVAMVGRGEFAYLIAEKAMAEMKIISEQEYAIVVWALLLSTITMPIALGPLLKWSFKTDGNKAPVTTFILYCEGHHHTGMHFEVSTALHAMDLDVLECHQESDGVTDVVKFVVRIDEGDSVDSSQIEEIRHEILEAINDKDAQVIVKPVYDMEIMRVASRAARAASCYSTQMSNYYKESTGANSDSDEYWVEVVLMHGHQRHCMADVIRMLKEEEQLHLMRAVTEDLQNTDRAQLFLRPVNGHVTKTMQDTIRKSLVDYLKSHQAGKCKHGTGTVMVKRVPKEDVFVDHPPDHKSQVLAVNTGLIETEDGFEIIVDICDASDDSAINEICHAVHDLDLDITSADIQHKEVSRQVHGMIFAQCELLKDTSNTDAAARKRRDEIKLRLRRMMIEHSLVGTIRIHTFHGEQTTSPQVITHGQPVPPSPLQLPAQDQYFSSPGSRRRGSWKSLFRSHSAPEPLRLAVATPSAPQEVSSPEWTPKKT